MIGLQNLAYRMGGFIIALNFVSTQVGFKFRKLVEFRESQVRYVGGMRHLFSHCNLNCMNRHSVLVQQRFISIALSLSITVTILMYRNDYQ